MIDAYFGSEVISDASLDIQETADSCVIAADPGKFAELDLQETADSCAISASSPGIATLDLQQFPDSCAISGGVVIPGTIDCQQAADSCLIHGSNISTLTTLPGKAFTVEVGQDDFTVIVYPRGPA